MNNTAEAVSKYRLATRELLQAGLTQFKQDRPDEYRSISLAAQQGAHFTVTSAISPAGLDEIHLNLVMPDGERVGLLQYVLEDDGAIK